MIANPPRILFAAPASGSGKTTVTCAVLQALCQRGLSVASFKAGPDYIDPMFHSKIIGLAAHQLDSFFVDETTLKALLCRYAGADLSVIEGAMGYYDGLGFSTTGSAFSLARVTKTPVILIVNAKGMAASLAALVKGFLEFEAESKIAGILLNQISPGSYPALKKMLEEKFALPVLGYLPSMTDCKLESRQLGLIPAAEVPKLQEKLCKLAKQAEETIELSQILSLAQKAEALSFLPPYLPAPLDVPVKIGVARDRAFCFYYAENLELLQELGAELVFFSPMQDAHLPKVDGLLLGGGYPEVFAKELEANVSMRKSIKTELARGLPCLAECGGFQYLQERMGTESGESFAFVGAVPGESFPTGKLCRFGYLFLTMQEDTILGPKGTRIPAHEFHHWDSSQNGTSCRAEKPLQKKSWECMVAKGKLLAGYPHLYFYAKPDLAKRFLEACAADRAARRMEDEPRTKAQT